MFIYSLMVVVIVMVSRDSPSCWKCSNFCLLCMLVVREVVNISLNALSCV